MVVTKLDRIARNVRDYIEISAELNESQVALVCLDLDIDTSTPDGQMIMRNHANLAQWQAERIAQYSLETARRHVSQGRPLGPAPVGYKKNGKETIVPDPVYRKHIETIDELYLRHKSMNRVVEELHKKGYKTPGGRTYTKPQIAYILRNLRYIGEQEHDGKILRGNWEPIRSMATHERIQKSLEANRRNNRSPNRMTNRYPYFFQSLLKCSYCHSTMIPRPGTNKAGNYYPYYMCMKAEKTQGIDCDKTYLPAETIDNAIIEFIRKLRLEPSTIEKVVRGANESTDQHSGEKENLDYTARLTATHCNYGSKRWWFICPLVVNGRFCQRRVLKLYLGGGKYFGCRHCYNLTYRSVREHDAKVDALLKNPDLLLRATRNPNNLGMNLIALKAMFKLEEKERKRKR